MHRERGIFHARISKQPAAALTISFDTVFGANPRASLPIVFNSPLCAYAYAGQHPMHICIDIDYIDIDMDINGHTLA